MSASNGEFKYSESRVAEQLGVSRTDMKFIRDTHIEADRDWKKNGREVLLTAAGVDKILLATGNAAEIDLDQCLANGSSANSSPSPEPRLFLPAPEAKKMAVSKICLNPSVVLANDDAGQTYSVWVGSSENFVLGDKIDAVPHPRRPGFWRILGPLPRDRRRIGGKPL